MAIVIDAAFDELIHAPLRLQICAMLAPVQSLPFADIRDALAVSDSVLSKHLSALAEAGYVNVSRVRAGSRSRRQVTLTGAGRTALRGHLAALRAIAATAEPGAAEPVTAEPVTAKPLNAEPVNAKPVTADASVRPGGARSGYSLRAEQSTRRAGHDAGRARDAGLHA